MRKYYSPNDGGGYDYVFAGATFLAAGAAGKLTRMGFRCLVFDRLMMPGHEFSYALRTAAGEAGDMTGSLTPEAAALYRELESRGAAAGGGRYHLPALTPALCLMMSRAGIEYFPLTSATGAEFSGGVWKLTLVSHGAITRVETKYIVDTTPDGQPSFLLGASPDTRDRTLNALMEAPPDYNADAGFMFGAHEMRATGFPGEYVARFSFPGDILRARAGLLEYITSSPPELRGWRVLSVAEEFDITRLDKPKFMRRGFLAVSSTSRSDAVAAYDAGVKLADSLAAGILKEPDGENYKSDMPATKEPEEYDLIVAGLGTAGAVAAISAAQRGLRVLGIERLGCMGGTGTAGAIPTQYLGFKGGLYEKIDREAAELRKSGFADEKGAGCVSKALALERAAAKAGGRVILGAAVVGVVLDANDEKHIRGVRWADADGIREARAAYTVDATADALLCLMSGCEMLGGRPSDGGFQLYSNVSRNYSRERDMLYSTNQDDGAVNQYNPAELGRAVIRSCASPLHLPPRFYYGRHKKLGPAPFLGIREGLRILGESTVTLPDITAGRFCDKPLFYEYSNLDNHGKDTALEERAFRDWIEICSLWDCRLAIPVPAGSLIPRGCRGLLAVGRCISVDHSVAFAARMKDSMQKCGEAAAELVSLAIELGCDAREVPYPILRERLEAAGVIKSGDGPRADYYNRSDRAYDGSLGELAKGPDKLCSLLASDSGGAAVMAAAMNIGVYSDRLREWMRDDGPVKLNCALALCLGGCVNDSNDMAAAVIIEAIIDRSGTQSESSHTFNFPYAISAISAAGRSGLTGAAGPLIKIIRDPRYADGIPDRDGFAGKTKLILDRDDVSFLYFTAALTALREICLAHPEIKNEVAGALSGIVIDDRYATSVSMIGNLGVRRDLGRLINETLNQIIN